MTPLAILQHVIVWLPLVVGGIFLIRAGLRGRRINDHPICRRCRFDLVGLTGPTDSTNAEPRPASRPERCPECGTSLTGITRRARRAVIDGERKKRWRLFALGVVLLLSGLTTGFWLSYKPLAKFPWTTWMPDWVLAEMVDSPNTARSKLVAQEILQRIRLDRFATSSENRAVRSLLRMQADSSVAWTAHMGDIIEGARAAGQVGDEAWAAYASNSVALSAKPHDSVEPGFPLRWMVAAEFRAGSRMWIQDSTQQPRGLFVVLEPQFLTLENGDRFETQGAPFPLAVHMGLVAFLAADVEVPRLPPGDYSGMLTFRLRAGAGFDPKTQDLGDPVCVDRLLSIPVQFTVVAENQRPSNTDE